MNRRNFLKITGMGSVAFAAGCSPGQDKNLFAPVRSSEDMVTGKESWYATTCRECPAGCGMVAKNREGRVVKLEGNPLHPVGKGKLCMRGQASIQSVYHPDRLMEPMLREGDSWKKISLDKALEIMAEKISRASAKGPDRIAMVTGVVGDPMLELMTEFLENRRCKKPLVFEPFSYDSLKKAHGAFFGAPILPSFGFEQSDFILGFGADFLETWLSPVAYAGAFKRMHAVKGEHKGVFFHVGPWRSLTAANADQYMSCPPGSEAVVALCLVRRLLSSGKGDHLPSHFLTRLKSLVEIYTDERAKEFAGLDSEDLNLLAARLLLANSPMVLGSSSTGTGDSAILTDMAATVLNIILDPNLSMYDFNNRHRVEIASDTALVDDFFDDLMEGPAEVLLVNGSNPLFALPPDASAHRVFQKKRLFKISFTGVPDETDLQSDLMIPVKHFLETWDCYESTTRITSTLQPAMGDLTRAPHLGDLILSLSSGKLDSSSYKTYLARRIIPENTPEIPLYWSKLIQLGGDFSKDTNSDQGKLTLRPESLDSLEKYLGKLQLLKKKKQEKPQFLAVPSIRFFDGRGGDKPWLYEIPDPVTKVAWQSPLLIHPDTLHKHGWSEGEIVRLASGAGELEAPVYLYDAMAKDLLVMGLGQGHKGFGRYAKNNGGNPVSLLRATTKMDMVGISYLATLSSVTKTGERIDLARTDGSDDQHDRKIALTVTMKELAGDDHGDHAKKPGLDMNSFPVTLPITDGYDSKRDFYDSHGHTDYRWGMAVDLDLCIGCGACVASCYAENNIGIVGEERITEGREMAWLRIERYRDQNNEGNLVFLPMMCQHCDNAPCESVCPVYAPHHSKEGINNQIYNRCIGTRFCAQNCPYKVRRFNWYEYKQAEPMNMQFNPNVTVRGKGVMEKCSFCIQRIKAAHGTAKNEERKIRDGEVVPACVQTCPTGALTFGNFMDHDSRLRWLCGDSRAYQVLGYLNTKPAVIYLKKVILDGKKDSPPSHS